MAVTNSGRVIKMTAASDAVTGVQYIYKVRWVKPGTSGDDLSLTNTAGTEFLASAAIANTDQDIELNMSVDGIKVGTLGSGTVYIYLKS